MNTIVRFLRPCAPYNTGECAGVTAELAAKLVRLGLAELVEVTPPLAAEVPAPEPAVDLPADLPGRARLLAAGLATVAAVRQAVARDGLGFLSPRTRQKLVEYLERMP